MKKLLTIAVLLTVLFLVPIFGSQAEEAAPFVLDEGRTLQGMNRSWRQGYEPTITNHRLTLALPLLSDQASGAIQTTLVVLDEAASPFKPQDMTVKTQPSGDGAYPVRMTLDLYQDRRNGDYACIIRITGQTADGGVLSVDWPYTIRIRDGLPSGETIRMRVSDVHAELKVGEDGWISAMLTNPCRTVSFQQPVLRIRDASGEIIPQSAEAMELSDLKPGESTTVRFPLTVLARAAVAPHPLQFELSWTSLGESFTQTEGFTIPVTQDMRLEQGGVKMASSVVAGDALTITLPLMNMGKADLLNVLASVSLPGMVEKQSVLVGTLTPGETKQAQLILTPDKNLSGDFTGTLNVEAVDPDGNPTALSLPISLTVEKPEALIPPDSPAEKEAATPYLTYILGGGCALLLIFCILQGTLLRRKIRQLEERML